jgi:hypothetical protein
MQQGDIDCLSKKKKQDEFDLRPRKGTHGFGNMLQPLIGPWCRFVQARMGVM